MSSAAVSTQSIYQEPQSFNASRQAELKQLGNALQSGDLNGALQAFNTLAQLGQAGPFANAEPFAKSSRAQAFETVGQDLQNGDLAGAQAAFASLTSRTASAPPPPAQTPPAVVITFSTSSTTGNPQPVGNSASIYQQLHAYQQQRLSDLAQLGQDLKAGNQNAAQQDIATLIALGQSGPHANGQVFQRADRAQAFQAIGQALQSGDLAGAQAAFNTLASTFGQNLGSRHVTPQPLGPPVVQGPPTSPPVTLPPVLLQPPNTPPVPAPPVPEPGGTTSTGSGVPEIVINLGPSGASNGAAPQEIDITLKENSSASGKSGFSEIDIAFGSASGSGATGGSTTPELVVNLGQSSAGNAEEVTINFGSGNSAGQISIEAGQGQNGTPAEQVTINLNQQLNNELILNLFNPNAASPAQSSTSALSVQA